MPAVGVFGPGRGGPELGPGLAGPAGGIVATSVLRFGLRPLWMRFLRSWRLA